MRMCVCVCVCVCVCACVCMHACMRTLVHACVCMHMCVYVCVHVCVCMCDTIQKSERQSCELTSHTIKLLTFVFIKNHSIRSDPSDTLCHKCDSFLHFLSISQTTLARTGNKNDV